MSWAKVTEIKCLKETSTLPVVPLQGHILFFSLAVHSSNFQQLPGFPQTPHSPFWLSCFLLLLSLGFGHTSCFKKASCSFQEQTHWFISMLHVPFYSLSLAACPMLLSKGFSALGYAQLVSGEEQTPFSSSLLEEVAPKARQPGQGASLCCPQFCYKPHNLYVYGTGLHQLSHTGWKIIVVGPGFSQPEKKKGEHRKQILTGIAKD